MSRPSPFHAAEARGSFPRCERHRTARPRYQRRALAGVLLAMLAACRAAPLPASATLPESLRTASEPSRLRIAPDDLVLITVFGYPELSSTELGQRVDYEGNLSLPLVGPVSVAGSTVEEARVALTDAVARVTPAPAVSLAILEYAPREVYVLGQVKEGGAFDLHQSLPALQALSLAGGFSDGADRANVALLRLEHGELVVHTFNADTPGLDGLVPVQAGDLLFVRQTGTGSFREEIMPYLQALAPPLNALASVIIVTDRLKN